MAKIGKAPCPVCGQEVVDPDFASNRARGAGLRCANCRTSLQWVRPFWQRFHFIYFVFAAIPDWIRVVAGTPPHGSPLRRFYIFAGGVAFLFGGISLAGALLEKMGIVPIRLKSTSLPYEYLSSHSAKLKEQRDLLTRAPRLQINPRRVQPSFLRGRSILFPDDSPSIDPQSQG
jgi:hypothetical protein